MVSIVDRKMVGIRTLERLDAFLQQVNIGRSVCCGFVHVSSVASKPLTPHLEWENKPPLWQTCI